MSLDRAFAHPWALWLLTVPPVLSVLAIIAHHLRRPALARLGRIPALTALTSRRPVLRLFQAGCRAVGLTFLILAIAGPQWGRQPVTATAPGRDLIVVLDMSRSMLAGDAVGASSPNRLGWAMDGLRDLADTVQKNGGHRLALIGFAARPRVFCPLTHDYDHFRDALANLDPADPELAPAAGSDPPPSGTRIGAAITIAAGLADPERQGVQDILLISDGDDPAHDREWQQGIDSARDAQIPVYTIGVGDPEHGGRIPTAQGYLFHDGHEVWTRLQEKPLEAIAARTGGIFTAARTDALRLGRLFTEQIEPRGGRADKEDVIAPYQQHAEWFYAGALLFLVLEILARPNSARQARNSRARVTPTSSNHETGRSRPRLVGGLAPAILLLVAALPVEHAYDRVRQGNDAFDRGDYQAALASYAQAEDTISDPGLVAFNEGAAFYELAVKKPDDPASLLRFHDAEVHYRRALQDATRSRKARALYGLANALVQQAGPRDVKALEEAVQRYQECLGATDVDPMLGEDARHNLAIARVRLEQARALRSQAPNESDDPENPRPPKPRMLPNDTGAENGGTDPGASQGDSAIMPAPGTMAANHGKTRSTDLTTPGDSGQQPVVPDTDKLLPMSPSDARDFVERAAARILEQRRKHWQELSPPASRPLLDW